MNGKFLMQATVLGVLMCAALQAQAQINFQPTHLFAGDNPSGLATGDFNADGYVDIAAVGGGPLAVRVLMGSEHGFFMRATYLLPKNAGFGKLVAGDLDRDGLLDLAVSLPQLQRVLILQNLGNFRFTDAGRVPTGISPHGMAIADFNRDGMNDLVVANSGSNTVSILESRGKFRFIASSMRTGAKPLHVALGDLNGDEYLDLVVSHSAQRTLGVYLNTYRGEFSPSTLLYTGGDYPDGLVLADWDADGDLDIGGATTNRDNGCAWLFFNDRSGFRAYEEFETPARGTSAMAAADFDGDGIIDFVTADRASHTMSVFIGRGDGMFYMPDRPIEIGAGPDELIAVDLDGDGDMDVVSLNTQDKTVTVLYNFGPRVFGF